jgi:hypothetical protein
MPGLGRLNLKNGALSSSSGIVMAELIRSLLPLRSFVRVVLSLIRLRSAGSQYPRHRRSVNG